MRINIRLFAIYTTCTFLLLSCAKKQQLSVIEDFSERKSQSNYSVNSVANLTIESGMTLSQMNSVIAAASSGQTVYVQPGTYNITAKLILKNGITLRPTSSTPVFSAVSNSTAQMREMAYTSDINNCNIIDIAFHNIRFKITDASNVNFQGCSFDYGVRKAGTDKAYLSDAYIHFIRLNHGSVKYCTFSRRINNSGRGIYNTGSTNVEIKNNVFGNGANLGYFVTAINDNSAETIISSNTINRIATWVNTAETDHGIYTHSFHNMQIIDNTISGWPPNAAGGAIKARNGEGLIIANNTFNHSGVLLYTYDHATQPYLNNVVVSSNNINLFEPPANDIYHGIGYWRNTLDGSEYSIRIYNNKLPNGTIKADFASLITENFNESEGGVFNNDIGLMYLKSGVYNTGNY